MIETVTDDLERRARALHAADWPESDWDTLNANSRNAWRRAAAIPVPAARTRLDRLRLALDEAERGGATVVRIEDVRAIVGGGE